MIHSPLLQSRHAFLDSNDDPTWSGRGRYSDNMLPDISIRHWRKGSQWFEMQRSLAAYVVSDEKYHGLFEKHCNGSCYPDEHFLPTFVNMFRGSETSNRTVTWADWSSASGRGRKHPNKYGAGNTTEGLVRSLRRNQTTSCAYNDGVASTCHLFARKFDASALEALLGLASRVMEF
ncbi:unnamed protein product [Linum tenue]|uniref:Uncharacterized protein n=1 Tax=Linum tenue TaxID=586396 RepID=A0AAV0K014_9ROSI|nr:unnamed protein product [Linum tenue]